MSEFYHTPTYINYFVNYISLTEVESNNKKERLNNVGVKVVNFPLSKETLLNLPLNIHYLGWGNTYERDSEGNMMINNLNDTIISDKIRINSIRIKIISPNNRIIELISNNNVVKSIIDQKVSENEFIRSFDNKEYHIKNNVPYFFFENKFSRKYFILLNK